MIQPGLSVKSYDFIEPLIDLFFQINKRAISFCFL